MDDIENNQQFKNLFESLNGNIIDLSEGNQKSFILTEEHGETKGYILKLNVNTIKKRLIN